jgi:hypothetical protein
MGEGVHDDRDLLALLKLELLFLENGYYERVAAVSGHPAILLRNSPVCLNFSDPDPPHPCSACNLMQFVPSEARHDTLPCHQIPITDKGETLYELYIRGNQREREQKLAQWLRATIRSLEEAHLFALSA